MDSETLRNELLTSQWYGISPGNISYTGGNVGIGVATPSAPLHVTSTVGGAGIVVGPTAPYTTSGGQFSLAVLNDGLTSGQYNAIQIGKSGSNSLFFTYNYTGAAATDYTSFTQYGSSSGTSLVVQGSGRVGVGTTNPAYKFETSGGAVAVTGTSNYLYYAVTNSTNSGAYMMFDAQTAGGSGRKYQIGSTGTGNNPGTGCFELYDATGGATRIVVNASGSVGIGSVAPVTNLDVTKTTATGTPAIEIRGGGGGPKLQVYGREANPQAWMGLGTDMAGGPYEHSAFFPSATSGTQGFMTFGAYNGSSYSEKMRISVNGTVNVPGVITNPGRPLSLVGKNNGDVSVAGMMLFNSVGYNVGSMYNSGTGYWTASVAGYYQFTYSGISRITSSFPNMRWFKNGGDFGWGACHFNVGNITAPNHMQLACSVIIYLAVNDNVYFYIASDGFYGASTIHNTACCIFLG